MRGRARKPESIYFAADRADEAQVRALLDEGVHPDEWRDGSRWTALHTAAQNGHTGVTRLLIDARANIEAKANDGRTPLHNAACTRTTGGWTCKVDVVRLLLEKGANANAKINNGVTPLHWAVRDPRSNAATIETLLLWGADLDARNDNGRTPRDHASLWNNTAAFDAVVAKACSVFWTRALHPRLPRPSREVVATVLMCLRRVSVPVQVVALPRSRRRPQAVALPALPVELWEVILGMARVVDLFPRWA